MAGRLGALAGLATLAWGASSVFGPMWARACSAVGPHVDFAVDVAGSLPANAIGLPAKGSWGPSTVFTWNEDATAAESISGAWMVEAPGSLTEGDQVTVRAATPSDSGDWLMAETTFAVAPAADSPTALGEAVATVVRDDAMFVIDETAGCGSTYHVARADVRLEVAESAQPWFDSAVVQLEVDGESFQHVTYPYGRYELDRVRPPAEGEPVIAFCGLTQGSAADAPTPGQVVSEGEHEVAFVALFADGSTQRTEPVTIELRCGELQGDDALVDVGDDTPSFEQAIDAGVLATTATQGDGGSMAAGRSASDETEADASNPAGESGCRATRASESGALSAVGLLAFGSWFRRRRGWRAGLW